MPPAAKAGFGGGGGAGLGGAIYNAGTLTLDNDTLNANQGLGGNGGGNFTTVAGSPGVPGGGPNGGIGVDSRNNPPAHGGFGSGGGGGTSATHDTYGLSGGNGGFGAGQAAGAATASSVRAASAASAAARSRPGRRRRRCGPRWGFFNDLGHPDHHRSITRTAIVPSAAGAATFSTRPADLQRGRRRRYGGAVFNRGGT